MDTCESCPGRVRYRFGRRGGIAVMASKAATAGGNEFGSCVVRFDRPPLMVAAFCVVDICVLSLERARSRSRSRSSAAATCAGLGEGIVTGSARGRRCGETAGERAGECSAEVGVLLRMVRRGDEALLP